MSAWYSQEVKDKAIQRFLIGESIVEISKSMGIKYHTIRNFLVNAGCKMKSAGAPRKYSLNENFFYEINNEKKAY